MKFIVFVLAVIFLIVTLGGYNKKDLTDTEADENTEVQVQQVNKNTEIDYRPVKGLQGIININVNSPSILSYTTKNYVYDVRKMYVQKSIFANKNYEPSDKVFGQIVDNKPWISSNALFYGLPCRVDGTAEEARFINNPSMLVAIVENAVRFNPQKVNVIANNPDIQFIPRRIYYNSEKNEIVVEYHIEDYGSDFKIERLSLNGLNARDFGYKFAFIDMSRTTLGMKFLKSDNISNRVVEFRNYIHLGNSCQIQGGCNNGSPKQPMLEFEPNFIMSEGEIYIKLWKNRPVSFDDEPDMVEVIKFIHDL